MAKPAPPTNDLLTTGLAERIIPLEVQPVFDLGTSVRVCAFVRLGALLGYSGTEIERYAELQGRRRELLIYLIERAARHIKTWRAHGFTGTLYVPLPSHLLHDRTLATSFDLIAKSQGIEQSAFTVIVPQADYLKRGADALNALWRVRKAGCGVAMSIDAKSVAKFVPLGEHPFSALAVGGKNVWKRLKTIGPGKLGDIGSWIGWAESLGLQRLAADINDEDERTTARLYGFGLGEGSHFAGYVPARSFLGEDQPAAPPGEKIGLPPPPDVAMFKRA